jgi:hypothetical protein
MYVPSLVKIHWRMLILECSQGCYMVKKLPSDLDHWPWKSIGFQTLLRTMYVPSLVVKIYLPCNFEVNLITHLWVIALSKVKVTGQIFNAYHPCEHSRINILQWILTWPWKSIGFQTLLRTMYVPSLVKIHWRMLILECSQGCYAVKIWPGDIDLWPMTLKAQRSRGQIFTT